MNVKQHIPTFCDFDHVETTAATLEELLDIEFIKRWPETAGFYRFSKSVVPTENDSITLLMAELDEGKTWWVVAYLTGEDAPEVIAELPQWERTK